MRTTLLLRSMDYVITAEAAGHPAGRRLDGSLRALVASLLLNELGIGLYFLRQIIGPVHVPEKDYHFEEISENRLYMPNNEAASKPRTSGYSDADQDSCGGTIECRVTGPARWTRGNCI